jgi:pentatricopeptide repeat protein
MFEKTLDVFEQMPFSPDDIISIILFKTCTQLSNERALKLGKNVFNQLPKKFYKNSALITSTLHMLMNFGDTTNAEKLFNDIDRKNIFYYGAMMDGYNINNEPEKCLKIFNQMQQNDIVPNVVIITLALGACSQIGSFSLCRSIVDQIPSYLLNNHRLQNTLIDAWVSSYLIEKIFFMFYHSSRQKLV